jgi:hypothetical protein
MKHHVRGFFALSILSSVALVSACTTSDVNDAIGVAANAAGAVAGVYGDALEICERYHSGCYIGSDGGVYYYSGGRQVHVTKEMIKQARRSAQLDQRKITTRN